MNSKYKPADLEPACFYLRKSREDQEAEARGEGETLAKHKKALFKLAKEHGVNITKVFEEVVSGESIIHRPEMLSLLKEVEAGQWASVFCMDIDRLGRGKMQDQGLILETFKNSQTKIVTPRKVYDLNDEFDEEYTEFEAFMARKELKIITRRLQSGRLRSVSIDRNYIGARPPYGYLIEKNAQGRTLVPHPEQAPVIKLIFELYVKENMGSRKIAHELNRLGKKTYTGKPWEPSTVLFIIKNEVYVGRLQWRKKEEKKSQDPNKKDDVRTRPREEWIDVEGRHEPLVSKELFAQAQTILKGKYHVPYQIVNGITNPLAGLIKCEICGGSMILRPYIHQKYPHLMCYNSYCENKSSRFEYVEKRLIEELQSWLTDYQEQWGNYRPKEKSLKLINIKEKSLRNLQNELKELEQQKDNLHDLLERKIYDEDTYLDRSQKLSDKISNTKSSILKTERELEKEIKQNKAQKNIIPKVKTLLNKYDQISDPIIKNKILKSILEYATYKKEKWQKGDDFTLILYPRLPK